MMMHYPLLGPRDSAEFTCFGDESLIDRPDWRDENAARAFYEYQHLRDDPAVSRHKLWCHEAGDRSRLFFTRDIVTHDITSVELARDVARARGRSR